MRTWHRRITLCIDLFYVAKNVFFCSTSRNINFHTIQPLESESYGKLLSHLQTIIDLYTARGFEVQHVREADEESDCSLLQFTQVSINMSQTGNTYKGLKNSWLLLDSCSNVDIFKNKHLLQDIFEVKDQSLNLQTNGGVMKSSFKGQNN